MHTLEFQSGIPARFPQNQICTMRAPWGRILSWTPPEQTGGQVSCEDSIHRGFGEGELSQEYATNGAISAMLGQITYDSGHPR
jgi:hypothetical protein